MRDIRIYKLTQNIIFDIKSMRIKSMREGEENMIYPSLLTSVYYKKYFLRLSENG